MADLRIIPGSTVQTPASTPVRAEAVKAAQRAFFNAALTEAQASAPVRARVQTPTPTRAASAPVRADFELGSSTPTDRILRPGSLLDIKV